MILGALNSYGGFHLATGTKGPTGKTHEAQCCNGHSCVCVKKEEVLSHQELATLLSPVQDPLEILIEREEYEKGNVIFL